MVSLAHMCSRLLSFINCQIAGAASRVASQAESEESSKSQQFPGQVQRERGGTPEYDIYFMYIPASSRSDQVPSTRSSKTSSKQSTPHGQPKKSPSKSTEKEKVPLSNSKCALRLAYCGHFWGRCHRPEVQRQAPSSRPWPRVPQVNLLPVDRPGGPH